ncbi:MAG TPA: YitT family protein [Candidatus Olsenella avicola]|uniref:YitT family protein n=1 Tax=Olsenella sp. An285 TaxID=1965621 RepID=UPI000B3AFF52|nr:YitT family protein [Olsenella sp. An285]OUO47182.1 membrane protein [Olsenella sp. An285]HIY51770.1 YitT family protein [Candidatus Olsenella avicola]
MSRVSWRVAARDALLIILGSLVFAVGVDSFEIPNGLAAGGVTGLATVFYAMADAAGFYLPVGLQTIVMNVALLSLVIRSGDRGYIVRTVAGIVACGILTDLLAPVVPVFSNERDLLLCALWGGVVTGLGLGLVFRTGGNTGGTDIVSQLLARKTGMPVGTAIIIVDGIIIAFSATVFSIEQALYAAVAMFICGKVIDMVVDGPRTQRAAYIISVEHEKIANEILYTLNRGCTELQARGVWSGNPRPVLFCVLGRSEAVRLKQIVAEVDPEAIVIISEVHEAFGEGFRQITGGE